MSENTDRRTGSVAVEMAANGVSDDTVQQVFEQERRLESERLKTQRTQTLIEVLTQNFDRILSFFEQLLDTVVGR
jgi:hypothetical protein